jgi:methylmalonyl-CoA mutase C-terminal domain/subunit
LRVLIAKLGLDGHDMGAKIVARALRDAGMEVIYTGLRQSVEGVVSAAEQEDVDVIGLSFLSGAHLPLTAKLMARLREHGLEHIPVVLGGTIPSRDVLQMTALGVRRVYGVETPLKAIVEGIAELCETVEDSEGEQL